VTLPNRNPTTTYNQHVASEFLDAISDYSETVNVTTGIYLAPYGVSSVKVRGLGGNRVRVKWRWGKTFRGEIAGITKYEQGKLPSYFVTNIQRSGDSRDKDDREDRVDIILEDQGKGNWNYVITPSNASGNGNSDVDSDNIT